MLVVLHNTENVLFIFYYYFKTLCPLVISYAKLIMLTSSPPKNLANIP